jgi:hypothetical protein
MGTRDPTVLSTSLGQYTAIAAARVARGTVAAPLPSAVTNPYEQMTSLRLQMAMDRLSKTASLMSNMLKKVSDEAQSITNNLK